MDAKIKNAIDEIIKFTDKLPQKYILYKSIMELMCRRILSKPC